MSDFDIQILNGNDFLITQFYGENPNDYVQFGLPFHIGIDFVSLSGNDWNIESVNSGKVLYAGWANGGYGNVVIILQDDNVLSKYMHLDSVFVSVNQRVNQGQEIGVIGNSGNSTGRHCHLECSTYDGNMWSISNHFDPIPYLNKLDDDIKNQVVNPTINFEEKLKNAIPAQFNEPEISTLIGAINNQDANYLLAFSGSEPRKRVAELEEENRKLKEANLFLSSEKTAVMAEVKKANNQVSELMTKQKSDMEELSKSKNNFNDDTVKSIINEAIKSAPAIIEVTSSNKKWYQSKKFWAVILGLCANVGMIIYPTQREIIVSLNGLFAVYLSGQSMIDFNQK